jgi:hypothetical protein
MKAPFLLPILITLMGSPIVFGQSHCSETFASTSSHQESNLLLKTIEKTSKEIEENMQMATNNGLKALIQGGKDWQPITPSLIKDIDSLSAKFRKTWAEVLSPEEIQAKKDIKTLLRDSSEFHLLRETQVETLATALMSRGPFFNTLHILNQARVEYGVTSAGSLKTILFSLQVRAEDNASLSSKVSRLKTLAQDPLFAKIKDRNDLLALKNTLTAELNKSSNIPEELIQAMVDAGKEASLRESSKLPSGYGDSYAAAKKYMSLIEKHPLLKDFSKSEMLPLQMSVNGVDRAEAIRRLQPFVPATKAEEIKQYQLYSVNKALELLDQ